MSAIFSELYIRLVCRMCKLYLCWFCCLLFRQWAQEGNGSHSGFQMCLWSFSFHEAYLFLPHKGGSKTSWHVSKIQEETTEMFPCSEEPFFSHFNYPSWHLEGKELSSDVLSLQEEQGFVAVRESKAAVSQKRSLLGGTREFLTHSH